MLLPQKGFHLQTLIQTTLIFYSDCCNSFLASLPVCDLLSLKPVSTQSQGAPFKTLSQISSLLLFKILILLGIQVKFLAMAQASHSCPRYLRDPISHHSAPGALPSSWCLERSSRVFAPASGPSCSLFHLPGMLFPGYNQSLTEYT